MPCLAVSGMVLGARAEWESGKDTLSQSCVWLLPFGSTLPFNKGSLFAFFFKQSPRSEAGQAPQKRGTAAANLHTQHVPELWLSSPGLSFGKS